MMVCIQCAMEAMLVGERYAPRDETAPEHMQRCHPDLEATKARRQVLERELARLPAFEAFLRGKANGQ